MTSEKGPLIIIGGHEDKEGKRKILRAIARAVGRASSSSRRSPAMSRRAISTTYKTAFADLGVTIWSSSM